MGSGCYYTSVVDFSHSCECLYMLSNPIKLGTDDPKTLRQCATTPFVRTSPLDPDRLCNIDSPAFRDQESAIETEGQDWPVRIIFDWRLVRVIFCLRCTATDV